MVGSPLPSAGEELEVRGNCTRMEGGAPRRRFGSDRPPGLSSHAVAWPEVAFSHWTGMDACPYYFENPVSRELDPPGGRLVGGRSSATLA